MRLDISDTRLHLLVLTIVLGTTGCAPFKVELGDLDRTSAQAFQRLRRDLDDPVPLERVLTVSSLEGIRSLRLASPSARFREELGATLDAETERRCQESLHRLVSEAESSMAFGSAEPLEQIRQNMNVEYPDRLSSSENLEELARRLNTLDFPVEYVVVLEWNGALSERKVSIWADCYLYRLRDQKRIAMGRSEPIHLDARTGCSDPSDTVLELEVENSLLAGILRLGLEYLKLLPQ